MTAFSLRYSSAASLLRNETDVAGSPTEGRPVRIDEIVTHLDLAARPRSLDKTETELLLELLEHWMLREAWEPVIEWASKAIYEGCSFCYVATVYRFWMEAALRHHDTSGVFSLCRHLLTFRRETDEFLALALYGLTKIDRKSLARPLARRLMTRPKKSRLVVEALATHAALFGSAQRAGRALRVLRTIAQSKAGDYLLLSNWYEVALAVGANSHATDALNELSQQFPDALEPLRVQVQIALEEKNWAQVVSNLKKVCSLKPSSDEESVALATALEYCGELHAARQILRSIAAQVSLDDYDFSVALGTINHKIFTRYGGDCHRIEAKACLENALRICPAYGLPSGNFRVMLHELGAGLPSSQVQLGTTSQARAPRFWLCMANDIGWRRLLDRQSFLIKVPDGFSKGDIVFLSRGHGLESLSSVKIEGTLEIMSPPVHDEQLEQIAKCGNFKMFNEAVAIALRDPIILCHDGHGLHNFAPKVGLYYAEFDAERAEDIVTHLETLGRGTTQKRVTNYA